MEKKLPYRGRLQWANSSGKREVMLIEGKSFDGGSFEKAKLKMSRKMRFLLGKKGRPELADKFFEGMLIIGKNTEIVVKVKRFTIIPQTDE